MTSRRSSQSPQSVASTAELRHDERWSVPGDVPNRGSIQVTPRHKYSAKFEWPRFRLTLQLKERLSWLRTFFDLRDAKNLNHFAIAIGVFVLISVGTENHRQTEYPTAALTEQLIEPKYHSSIEKTSNVLTITLGGTTNGAGDSQPLEASEEKHQTIPTTDSQSRRTVTHLVVGGDTLWDITKRYVKDPFMYPELARLSNIVDPDLIYPGDIVRIQFN